MLVSYEKEGIYNRFTADEKDGKSLMEDDPFHTASIGKTFVSTLFHILEERKELTLDDGISDYFVKGFLDGLFVYEGVDHQKDVNIGQLLTHTSGIADFF